MKSKIFFLVYSSFILTLIFFNLNPNEVLQKSIGEFKLETDFLSQPIIFSKSEISEPTFLYRENFERNGIGEDAGQNSTSDSQIFIKKAWATERLNVGIHSASKASVAADESGVYVGSDAGWFYAFSNLGKLKWKTYFSNSQRGIHSTAALDKYSAYVGSYNGWFYSIDKLTGKINWMKNLGGAIGSSPLLVNGHLFVTAETIGFMRGALYILEASTGETILRTDWIREQIHSSPAYNINTKMIFFGANDNNLYAIREFDGQIEWKYSSGGPIKGTPILVNGLVCFSSWDSYLYCLQQSHGVLKWKSQLHSRSQSSPVYDPINKTLILSSNGLVQAFSIETGKQIWSFGEINDKNYLLGSGLILKRKKSQILIISCETHKLCFMNPKNGKLITSYIFESTLSSVPTYFDNKVFIVPNQAGLTAIQLGPD